MVRLEVLRKYPHHSFSSINAFLNICPLQYAMRYVYKAEAERTSVNLLFGKAFHGALAWLASGRESGTYFKTEELKDVFSELWSVERRSNPKKVFKSRSEWGELNELGRKMADAFYSNWIEDDVVEVSKVFSVILMDADDEPVSDKPLIGEIDVVVRDEAGNYVLIDWKTAARKWPEGKAKHNLQATCFCYAWKQLYDVISPFRFDVITKTKAPTYSRVHTTRTVDDFHRLAELVKVVERAVKAEAFFPMTGGFYCGDCAYSNACKNWHCERAKTISIAA